MFTSDQQEFSFKIGSLTWPAHGKYLIYSLLSAVDEFQESFAVRRVLYFWVVNPNFVAANKVDTL